MVSSVAQAQLQIQKAKIPQILVGTSPFIGAGQFGVRAFLYYSRFYEHPANMVKIFSKAVDLGVRGVQLLPFPPVVEAIKSVERDLGLELTIVGSVRSNDPYGDIGILRDLRAAAMLLNGDLTDSHDTRKISELLNQIHQAGSLTGVVTHAPLFTLTWLQKTDLEIDMIMLPFNKLGKFMDSTPERVLEAARRINKPLIGMKVLAAGDLTPREGLEYVFQRGLKVVAIGLASGKEAAETLSIANELSRKY
jgi:hypothetical protein